MNIAIGMTINDAFIDNLIVDVEVEGYEEFQHTENDAQQFSADMDEDGTFWEALQYASKTHYELWERDHEYKDVLTHTEKCLRDRLEEEGFINPYKQANPLTCEWGDLAKEVRITEGNKKAIKQCVYQVACDIAWLKSESLQVYFQTLNPCCWDGRTPKERYGQDWIKDTETRLFLMLDSNTEKVNEEVYNRLTRDNYKSVLRNTSKNADVYEVLWNDDVNYYIY